MTCAFNTPTDALNAVLLCTQQALDAGGFGVPTQIVVGGAGADGPFTCCDGGLLAVTFDGLGRTADSSDRTKSSGNGSCVEYFEFDVHVKVLHCIATFNKNAGGGATDGGSVSTEQRTADSLSNVREAWYLLQALNCCAGAEGNDSAWRGCRVKVTRQDLIAPRGQCTGHDTTVHVELRVCCPPK